MYDTLNHIIDNVSPSQSGLGERFGSIGNISAIVLNFLIGVGFSIGIIAIAYSAYMYTMSGGNPDNTKKAWHAFLYGVIGAMFSIALIALKNIVVKGIGVETPDITGTPGF
jgi:hypothetical protein